MKSEIVNFSVFTKVNIFNFCAHFVVRSFPIIRIGLFRDNPERWRKWSGVQIRKVSRMVAVENYQFARLAANNRQELF